jgi:hypothetical protein
LKKLLFTLYFKVLFMYEQDQQSDTLQDVKDIKRLMERSSRFISLSGLSGIAAGICGLIGAFVAKEKILQYKIENADTFNEMRGSYIFRDGGSILFNELIVIGALTFFSALVLAFIFTYLRSKKTNVPIWGRVALRVMINVAIPMIVGAFIIYRVLDSGYFELIAPLSLLFYGLALVNASKYTLAEIRYLGYCELFLGIINLWVPARGLYFWAIGFGALHIIYGIIMWWKYERKPGINS